METNKKIITDDVQIICNIDMRWSNTWIYIQQNKMSLSLYMLTEDFMKVVNKKYILIDNKDGSLVKSNIILHLPDQVINKLNKSGRVNKHYSFILEPNETKKETVYVGFSEKELDNGFSKDINFLVSNDVMSIETRFIDINNRIKYELWSKIIDDGEKCIHVGDDVFLRISDNYDSFMLSSGSWWFLARSKSKDIIEIIDEIY